MDLLLWRHAEAHEMDETTLDDMARRLTARSEKQAQRMAKWLELHLPETARVLSSPARRCEQTASFLDRKYKIREELSPSCSSQDLLQIAQWPLSRNPVLVVGHQPALGQTIAQLLQMKAADLSIRKASVWWLRCHQREDELQIRVHCVVSPDSL